MPSRRSHTKSHHGCRQCKVRRVKCDEATPQCQRCVKRQIACSFIEDGQEAFLTPAASSINTDQPTPNITEYQTPEIPPRRYDHLPPPIQQKHVEPTPPSPAKRFDLLELELIHHYCTKTYMTLSSRLSTHVIFRDAIFREALRHEFLLHAIMATSALHKATTQLRSSEAYEEYAKVALTHQNAALRQYIPAVTNPNQDNSIALFSLSLLLSVWAFASNTLPEGLKSAGLDLNGQNSPSDSALPMHSPTSQFVNIVMILRGIYPVIEGTDTWLQGDIEDLLRYPREEDLPAHPPDVEEAFNLLATTIKNHRGDIEDQAAVENRELCLEQVERLRNISRCRSVVEWDGHIFSFLIMAPPLYITKLKRGDELCLAVFVHWAAAFRCMDHHWWAHGWSQTLVADMSNLLDLRVWGTALEWPRRQVNLLFQEGSLYENRRRP